MICCVLSPLIIFQVLTKDAWLKIGLERSINWIEICYKWRNWHIKMKWENGSLLFNKEWLNFVKKSKIVAVDICLFHCTAEPQRFEIVVLEKFSMGQYNRKDKISVFD